MRALVFASLVVAAFGCQQGDGDRSKPRPTAAATATASATPAYVKDIDMLCDVIARSGVPDDDARTLTVANWLAANLTTQDSRQFLVKIQPLQGGDKADALEAEAKRVGLSQCALAALWRAPAAVTPP